MSSQSAGNIMSIVMNSSMKGPSLLNYDLNVSHCLPSRAAADCVRLCQSKALAIFISIMRFLFSVHEIIRLLKSRRQLFCACSVKYFSLALVILCTLKYILFQISSEAIQRRRGIVGALAEKCLLCFAE